MLGYDKQACPVTTDCIVAMGQCENNNNKHNIHTYASYPNTRAGRVDGQRKEEAAQTLWGMLYADDAGVVSRSPEGLEKMLTVIVTACAAFGLTASEAKTEIMSLQTKGGGHVTFTVTAAG